MTAPSAPAPRTTLFPCFDKEIRFLQRLRLAVKQKALYVRLNLDTWEIEITLRPESLLDKADKGT